MTFIYEIDPYSLETTGCANTGMNFVRQGILIKSYHLTEIHTYRQTDRQTRLKLYTTVHRRWSKMNTDIKVYRHHEVKQDYQEVTVNITSQGPI